MGIPDSQPKCILCERSDLQDMNRADARAKALMRRTLTSILQSLLPSAEILNVHSMHHDFPFRCLHDVARAPKLTEFGATAYSGVLSAKQAGQLGRITALQVRAPMPTASKPVLHELMASQFVSLSCAALGAVRF